MRNQHRTPRVRRNGGGDTADHDTGEPRTTVRTEDDQAGVTFVRHFAKDPSRSAWRGIGRQAARADSGRIGM